MYFIQDSGDLLNIVIAIAVLCLTVFFCWAFFYLAMILRQSFKMIREMRGRINKLDELIKTIKEKLEHKASYLVLIMEGIKKLVEVVRERKEKKGKKK